MRILTIALSFLITVTVFGQDRNAIDSIVSEGKRLYRSEMASWYGTDIFLEKFKDQRENIGGYFSYADNDLTNCVFFSKDEHPEILATISFDSTFSTETAKIDGSHRALSESEAVLYAIRRNALELIRTDSMFKSYTNTSLNLIPVAEGADKKVYALTGPSQSGLVIFGNDYLLTFDANNQVSSKRQLHRNILIMEYGKNGQTEIGSMHSHSPETGDYITATDICTLMLYEKFAKWQQHMVISAHFVSVWNCETNQLAVLSMKDWDKANGDGKRKKK